MKENDMQIEEFSVNEFTSPQCVKIGDNKPLALQMNGDVVIGGIFPLHYLVPELQPNYQDKPPITVCNGFDQRAFRWMMTMVFAVEEINNHSSLLPDVKLGYQILDSCDNVHSSLQALFSLISFPESVTSGNQIWKVKNTINLANEKISGREGLKSDDRRPNLSLTQEESLRCLSGSPIPVVIGLASSSPTRAVAQVLGSFNIQLLLYHLKKGNFTNQFQERVYFDTKGEPVPLYDIVNWQKDSKGKIRFVKVGDYDGSAPQAQQLRINESTIVWTGGLLQVPVSQCSAPCPPGSRQARRPGRPHCCFDCLPCADGEISNKSGSTECIKCPDYYWSDKDKVKCVAGIEEFLSFSETMGIILVVLTLLGVILTIIITVIFHCFRTTPIVKANNSEISFLLLLSLKLCFLCSLVFIGQPSAWTCMLRQAAFGISFVICLSCLLVKTVVVLLAFRANIPSSKGPKLFGPSQQRTMIFCTTTPQICLCVGWLLGAPPFPIRNLTYQASYGKIILECKEPWPLGFYLLLSYIGLLAFLCLLLAFLGRKLPDTFNEAKLITFSMLIFWAVWLCFIPAYVSSPGKFSVAVEIFAILASSFGLLLCIFLPKCYIILLHPERNTRKGMTGKYNRYTP
ncbi:PREDICTED: extracellular calcium-sensing receptor-like [Cyprinodon variegatus]|uniref:extracellular calcium-sensing receptor-like n=1 Tax=Cyprinodon variegatus TaxID=28743 RepID=UPI0007429761|nr:PREDICTED: extracellular calcium-sensing receptor-like [Cyprinodon variegatus]